MADLHLPMLPGTDVMLFHGLLHIMLWEGWTDAAYIAAHTSGFDALKALVRDCTRRVAQTCGIAKEDLTGPPHAVCRPAPGHSHARAPPR
jgi:assimilatory nitrate reductase catalytic subunit